MVQLEADLKSSKCQLTLNISQCLEIKQFRMKHECFDDSSARNLFAREMDDCISQLQRQLARIESLIPEVQNTIQMVNSLRLLRYIS